MNPFKLVEDDITGKSADPERGKSMRDYAITFAKDYLIGTRLTSDELNEWMDRQGLLQVSLLQARTSPVFHKALMVNRQNIRNKLNKAAIHPYLAREGVKPYVINCVGRLKHGEGMFEVQPVLHDIVEMQLPKRVHKLVNNHSRRRKLLVQSGELVTLPMAQRMLADVSLAVLDIYRTCVANNSIAVQQMYQAVNSGLGKFNELTEQLKLIECEEQEKDLPEFLRT